MGLADVEHLNDVWMQQTGGCFRLAQEASHVLLLPGELWVQELDRDASPHAFVAGLVHRTHAPAPDAPPEAIASDEERAGPVVCHASG